MNNHSERPSHKVRNEEPFFSWWRKRLPDILQASAAECGLACLTMIACYHGYHIDLALLRRRFAMSLKGMTARQLMEAAHNLGFQCRAVRLEMDELANLELPCVLHWDLDHFVVLARVRRHSAVIHDPAAGIRRMSLDMLATHFTGVAIEFSRGPAFRRRRADPPISLRTLAGSVRGLGRSLAVIFSMALVLELFALLAPLFMQLIVDQVLIDGDYDLLTFLGLSFILLLVLETTVSALRSWSVIRLSTRFNLGWTGNVFQHLLRLPQSYFHARHIGDVVSRFGAIDTIQQTLTTRFVEVILDGMMATITAGALFFYNPILASITLTSMLIYCLLRFLYFHIYRESNLSQITTRSRQQSSFLEAVRGIQTIRLYNQESGQTSRFLNVTTKALNTSVAVQRLDMLFTALQSLTAGAQRICVLWLGAWLGLKGQMTVGMLTAFVAYSDQFSSRVASLIDYSIELRMLRLQTERLADIVLTPPEPYTHSAHAGPEPVPDIAFEKVAFRYGDGEPWVLNACSFSIAPGESVAIVGASGCGKSTLVRLLLGLLDPQQGTIRVGGMDLRHLGKTKYRSMTASVMQDDHLFTGSIADNISFFDEQATLDDIQNAARLAGVHDDIIAMPMGYHSLVGDMGSSLSGGQRQRIYLARALYKRPRILVMDEATSHLDVNLEQQVNRAIAALNITRIIIAHRPETINQADRVIELISGKARPRMAHMPQNGPEDAGSADTYTVTA